MSLPESDPVVLYLLMRTDMTSMNPGKACAQAHHAGVILADRDGINEDPLYREWLDQAGTYGTVLTFGVTETQLLNCTDIAHFLKLIAGIVVDPSYPVRDGQVTHSLHISTCGYILCRKSQAAFLSTLQLMY